MNLQRIKIKTNGKNLNKLLFCNGIIDGIVDKDGNTHVFFDEEEIDLIDVIKIIKNEVKLNDDVVVDRIDRDGKLTPCVRISASLFS